MKSKEEDYLRIIYELDDKGVKSVNIAKKLKISKASVSEMLRKLAKKQLVKIQPYSKVFLTSKGKVVSKKISENHDVINRFMKKFILDEEKAKEETHKLEHAFSQDSIDILQEVMEGKRRIIDSPCYIG